MSGRLLTVALAGNPNCGKTSVFNALTGRWTDYEENTWEVTARSTVAFTK